MKLHFSRWGEPGEETEKIVFLHGMGGTGALWRTLAAGLESTFQILAPDQRGHGGSQNIPPEDFGFTPLHFGKDVVETLDAQGFHPAWIIGHSMGVRTAAATAFLRPKWAKGVVLVDLGLSGGAGGGLNQRLSDFLSVLPAQFPSRDAARSFMNEKCPDPAMAQYLMAVSTRTSTGEVLFPFDRQALIQTLEAARGVDLKPWIRSLASQGVPLLLVRGGKSLVWSEKVFKDEQAQLADLPNVRFQIIEGAGHGLPFEKREEFLSLLRAFTGKP